MKANIGDDRGAGGVRTPVRLHFTNTLSPTRKNVRLDAGPGACPARRLVLSPVGLSARVREEEDGARAASTADPDEDSK